MPKVKYYYILWGPEHIVRNIWYEGEFDPDEDEKKLEELQEKYNNDTSGFDYVELTTKGAITNLIDELSNKLKEAEKNEH